MVLTDYRKHTAAPGYDNDLYISPEQVSRPELELSAAGISRVMIPRRASTFTTTTILERPSVDLKTKIVLTRTYTPSKLRSLRLPLATIVQKPMASSMPTCASTSSAASSRPRRR
jgi:hypothetical protein